VAGKKSPGPGRRLSDAPWLRGQMSAIRAQLALPAHVISAPVCSPRGDRDLRCGPSQEMPKPSMRFFELSGAPVTCWARTNRVLDHHPIQYVLEMGGRDREDERICMRPRLRRLEEEYTPAQGHLARMGNCINDSSRPGGQQQPRVDAKGMIRRG
jgi:hypothetical protein